ncbi:hypothetical protein B0T24DRAFT_195128 [Lasiosphaeria ovina]|uniref:Uncharacterized protein n=1 Tax=Lasiosphaeria ovina TaxID=92902 RepID=A0AAE0NFE9_9PEZI|nr:hypothetical protein B0T24DRAFT_195128 [Lasiosphaeria ovina]
MSSVDPTAPAQTAGGANSHSQDFGVATAPNPSSTASPATAPAPQHVSYPPNINIHTNAGGATSPGPPATPASRGFARSDTILSPTIRRRTARAGTFKTVEDFQDFEVRPGWQPGAEPGVDPSKPDGGHASMPTLNAPCQISVIDFSQQRLSPPERLGNETLQAFLNLPKPDWVKCRWINVNGLSWDVIKELGQYKNLHRLAIEDIMNTRNRTKAEWFPTHAFIVLTLQKLVHLYDSNDDDDDGEDSDNDFVGEEGEGEIEVETSDNSETGIGRVSGIRKCLRRLLRRRKHISAQESVEAGKSGSGGSFGGRFEAQFASHPTGFSEVVDKSRLRTLQRYQASPNDPRTKFMEKHSSLSSKDLAVACEQVSMFITNDNTIISFFEMSAQDVEGPIVKRLRTSDTILRQSCDASMVGQAIIDAIIDLAIPVTACYSDVIGDLELDVLTRPNVGHTKKLYIVITEINKMLSFINPIVTLINTLRDHKTEMPQEIAASKLQDPAHGVILTPMTYTYLGDVLDHCVLITESLNQLKGSADGMIGLIFNTISTSQNESMKQLTVATIIFLPLTFLTGYFGQNFNDFEDIKGSVNFFWKIATPVVVAVIVILLWEDIWHYFRSLSQRRYIGSLRKRRSRRRERARK